jgi:hypothetical protein
MPHPFWWEAATDHQVLTVSIWIICVKGLIIYVISTEVYFLGDLNIDWLLTQEKASNCNHACNLVQVIYQSTYHGIYKQNNNKIIHMY